MSISEKYVTEAVDNLTKKEMAKYKVFDNFNGNGFPKSTTLSNGTVVKLEDMSLPNKISGFNIGEQKNSKTMSDFMTVPKYVGAGRLGYTTYVKPILDDIPAEDEKGTGYNT